MIFYKKRNQAALVWDKDQEKTIAEFTRIKRTEYGIDGRLETKDPKVIKVLKAMKYQFEDDEPETVEEEPENKTRSRKIDK